MGPIQGSNTTPALKMQHFAARTTQSIQCIRGGFSKTPSNQSIMRSSYLRLFLLYSILPRNTRDSF